MTNNYGYNAEGERGLWGTIEAVESTVVVVYTGVGGQPTGWACVSVCADTHEFVHAVTNPRLGLRRVVGWCVSHKLLEGGSTVPLWASVDGNYCLYALPATRPVRDAVAAILARFAERVRADFPLGNRVTGVELLEGELNVFTK